MNLLTLAEMAATGMPGRIAVGPLREPDRAGGAGPARLTYPQLLDGARAGASLLRDCAAAEVVYLGVNGPAFPLALLSAAWAGIPLVPLNYRLGHDQLAGLLSHHPR